MLNSRTAYFSPNKMCDPANRTKFEVIERQEYIEQTLNGRANNIARSENLGVISPKIDKRADVDKKIVDDLRNEYFRNEAKSRWPRQRVVRKEPIPTFPKLKIKKSANGSKNNSGSGGIIPISILNVPGKIPK